MKSIIPKQLEERLVELQETNVEDFKQSVEEFFDRSLLYTVKKCTLNKTNNEQLTEEFRNMKVNGLGWFLTDIPYEYKVNISFCSSFYTKIMGNSVEHTCALKRDMYFHCDHVPQFVFDENKGLYLRDEDTKTRRFEIAFVKQEGRQ